MINLAKKRLLLGITGGVAAYKAAELVRLLVRQNVEVQVVMTQAACQFITPVTMQALSGRPVFTDLWDNRIDNGMAHIECMYAPEFNSHSGSVKLSVLGE